jgi:hypothetical protein
MTAAEPADWYHHARPRRFQGRAKCHSAGFELPRTEQIILYAIEQNESGFVLLKTTDAQYRLTRHGFNFDYPAV